MIKIYTDGSSRGNPGIGGYGIAVLASDKELLWYYAQQYNSPVTNNAMELEAIRYALELTQTIFSEEECIIYSDSAYCVNICNKWVYSWANNEWRRSRNQEIENLEVIKQIYKVLRTGFPNFTIEKCNGHCGNPGNELADALATGNQAKFVKILNENGIRDSFKFQI